MSSAPTVLILPGINGSGPSHWQSLWEGAIPGARRVMADDWDHPVCAAWVQSLWRAVAGAPGQAVLVAHSLGCLQVVHATVGATGAAFARKVGGALLVAPPDPDAITFPDVAASFSPVPLEPLPFPSILVASRDDPYSDFAFSRQVAGAWGSALVDAGAGGHLNAESNLGAWPAGRRELDRLLGSAAPLDRNG